MYRWWWWDRRPRVRAQEFIREPPQKEKKTKTKPVGRWLAELMGCSAQRQQLAAAAWPSLSCKSAAVQDTAAHSGSTAVRRRTTLPGKAFEKWQPPAAAPIVITSCSRCSESKERKGWDGDQGGARFLSLDASLTRLSFNTQHFAKNQTSARQVAIEKWDSGESVRKELVAAFEMSWLWINVLWRQREFLSVNGRHPDKNYHILREKNHCWNHFP